MNFELETPPPSKISVPLSVAAVAIAYTPVLKVSPTPNVAVCDEDVYKRQAPLLLIAVKLGILTRPLAPREIEVLSLVQLKEVPLTVPVKATSAVDALLQTD